MYKYFVIQVLLLLFVVQSNNFLCASETSETKIVENIGADAETGTDIEATVEKNTTTLQEVEANIEEGASVAVTEAEAKEEEGETIIVEAVAKEEETVVVEAEETNTVGVETGDIKDKNATTAVKIESKPEKSSEPVKENEGDVVATVNDEKIIRKDFDRRLNVFRRLNQDVTRTIKLQVIDQLTKRTLLKQFVEKQNIEVGNDEIQEELEKIKYFLQSNQNNTDKSLEEILKSQNSSITELEEEVKRTLALSKYIEINTSDDDKKKYFDENKNAFNGARVKASHVLIDTRGMKTESELEEAKKMIEVVKMEIDKGADFAQMAKTYSNCPSAEKGGDIGFFQRKGSIVEEFAKVAFEMDAGEISDPVKTQFGYHIINVTEKEEGQDVNYEEVKDMVDFVYMQMRTESILKELYEKAKIEIFL